MMQLKTLLLCKYKDNIIALLLTPMAEFKSDTRTSSTLHMQLHAQVQTKYEIMRTRGILH